jgi:hypothetical protein
LQAIPHLLELRERLLVVVPAGVPLSAPCASAIGREAYSGFV